MEIIFATKNKGKLKEIKEILKDYTVLGMEEAGIDIDVIEDGETYEENALKKARQIMQEAGKVVLSDDSGVEIDYFDKKPGVHSAYFLGQDTPYTERNAIILDMLKDAKGSARSARYVAVIAAAFPDGRELTTKGVMEGYIGHEARGENGFGYDPIFCPEGHTRSVAELSNEEKNAISHRGAALRKMKGLLEGVDTL